ncbi:MAG: HlyD family efflux transporter periplasmic adaptor subunit [Candidatus Pacebacteria bacterium]|nr:HlyD family efflux transporter periplasmic adaptor subunit [Candidatus Paceibacterota bacterium]
MRTSYWYMLAFFALAGIAGVAWFEMRQVGTVPAFEVARVEQSTVEYIVSVTGRAEPLQRVSLAFPVGGRIERMAVKEGDVIVQGALVARLERAYMEAQLLEAEARVTRERTFYEELIAPIRNESVRLEDVKVVQAREALARADDTARTALARAYVQVEDALHRQIDTLFEQAPEHGFFGIEYTTANATYRIRGDYRETMLLNDLRADAERAIAGMRDRMDDSTPVSELLALSGADLLAVERLSTELARVVNGYSASDIYEEAAYAPFQTAVQQARATIAQVRGDIDSVASAYDGHTHALNRAIHERDLAFAGVRSETVRTQQAAIALAERGYASVRAKLEENDLVSPVSGRVVRIEPLEGETVHAYDEVLAVEVDAGSYEVQVYMPEVDIARVSLGDRASITFDAFGREYVFDGKVVRIALAETVREGVPTYKTTIAVTDTPDVTLLVRPGMTADVDITTDERSHVLTVPTRSILARGEQKYVRLVEGTQFTERPVTVGLRGSQGTTEIVEGLSEGDEVVVYMKE